MEWNTPVAILPQPGAVTHHHRMMLFGSCFAEYMGERLHEYHFPVDVNPFGIQYNPFSIASSMERLIGGKPYGADELFREGNLWHSFAHHSAFSHTDRDLCLQQINRRFLPAADLLRTADRLIFTWGTSWVYILAGTDAVVANCHKLPASRFERRQLGVGEMCDRWFPLLETLFALNPRVEILCTVSPVRHFKDGAHGNQLSKAALMLFTDELCRKFPSRCTYFPAYEIVLDELRDYRFYDTDMVHPSAQAIDYVWERFSDAYFDESTRTLNREWARLLAALRHRPLTPDRETYRQFVVQNILKLENFREKYAFFEVSEELSAARQLLATLETDEI